MIHDVSELVVPISEHRSQNEQLVRRSEVWITVLAFDEEFKAQKSNFTDKKPLFSLISNIFYFRLSVNIYFTTV